MSNTVKIKVPKIGRPTVMTQSTLDKVKTAYAYGCNDTQASLFAEIHPDTLRKYIEKHPDFNLIKKTLQDNPILMATRILFDNMEDKPELALKVLEKLTKRYSNNNDVNVNVKDFETFLTQIKSASHTTNDDQEDGGG